MDTNKAQSSNFSNIETCGNADTKKHKRDENSSMNTTHSDDANRSQINEDKKEREHNRITITNKTNHNVDAAGNNMNVNNVNALENNENNSINNNNSNNNQGRQEERNLTNKKPVAHIGRVTNVYTCEYNKVTDEEDAKVHHNIQNLHKKANENGLNWVEITETSEFWNSLTNNFKHAFQINNENHVYKTEIKQKSEKTDTDGISMEEQSIMEKEEAGKTGNCKVTSEKNKKEYALSMDVLVNCLHFLPADKIMECEILNKLTSELINTRPVVFKYIKNLNLNEKWAKLSIFKRQFYLHQMKHIRHLKVSESVFSENGMYIHEVAAVIFQNTSTLKSLELLSPELHSSDNTPRHEPFAFCACSFPNLEKLTIIGCQTLEWLHILRNATFPSLKKFEVCYYPIANDIKHWKENFDFTILGVQGLYRTLYTMQSLQRVTIGFDVLFDNADGEIENPLGSRRNTLEPYSVIRTSRGTTTNGGADTTAIPPANGYPSRRFRSYRGKLCEEDYSDIFSIAYFIAGKYGKLKRIMIKYRNAYAVQEDDNARIESLNEFVSGAANTAAVCYNYVINWFRSPNEI